ncbi:MAG: protein kinase [Terracidiphilus sp.]
MTPEKWRRVEELFATARELGPQDQDNFLREKCGKDNELEREVISLLRYHHSNSELLSPDSPPWRDLFSDAAHLPTLASGVTFGHYLIRTLVGSGGMGEVYLADDTRLHRKVALKLLPAWFNREDRLVARFTQEALTASALNHPNVPVVYEAGEIDQRHYIASEYVEGGSLTDRISQSIVPWREAIEIVLQVARALQAAHTAGIIHRDVKPGNILVANDGSIKLADFGIAKLVEGFELQSRSEGSMTATGVVIGTPGYMAPEQAAGLHADARSDLWSLAAVLHEMVAGKLPTPGDPRISISSNLPSPLARVLTRALQPDPAKRYQTVEEFATALNRARRALPLGRHTALVSGVAAIVLLLAIGYAVQLRRKPRPEAGFRVREIVKLTTSGNVVDATISPDSRYVIYSVEQSGQESLRLHQVETGTDIERVAFVNGHYMGLTLAPDGNYFYYTFDPHGDVRYLYQASILGGVARKIIDDIDSPPAFSPDGRQLAFIRGNAAKADMELHVTDSDGSRDRIVATTPMLRMYSVYGVAWSHDGKTIYSGEYDESSKAFVVGIDVSSGREHRLSQPEWDFIGRVSLLSDDVTLIFPATTAGSNSPELIQFSIAKGKWNAITSDLAGYEYAQSAGSDIVAVQKDRLSSIWVAPARAPSSAKRITSPAGKFDEVVWSRDGTMVSNSQAGGGENLWRIERNGALQQLTTGHFVDDHPGVSPDGKSIAFSTNRAGGWTIWTIDSSGQNLRQLTHGGGFDWYPNFAPDGSILYSPQSLGHFRILRIKSGGGDPTQLLTVEAKSPVVSPTGRYMACRVMDQKSSMHWQAAVVDLRSLRIVRRYPRIPPENPVVWLPDETSLTYVKDKDGVSNIWRTSIVTGREEQLTAFKEDSIFSFDWSLPAGDLALVRGITSSDVLLIRRAP